MKVNLLIIYALFVEAYWWILSANQTSGFGHVVGEFDTGAEYESGISKNKNINACIEVQKIGWVRK